MNGSKSTVKIVFSLCHLSRGR